MSQKYVEPHLTTINDLFNDFKVEKVRGEGNVKRKYKCSDKKALARKIFLRYLYHLMCGMMEGGTVFSFPMRATMELRWRRIPDYSFKKARAAGKLSEVDIVMTDRTCYELGLFYKLKNVQIFKPVKLSKNFYDMFITKVNTGFKYC